ncbi:MAG: HD domain-containing protein [Desulfovibrio sp.]|nr:HD domain-containing protein [Desulfovibrio sp.]
MDIDITEHEEWFLSYVDQEMEKEENDCSPMELKRQHTFKVLANARRMVESERPQPWLARATLLAALYHDVARFEQYLQYHTFRDRESLNHGRYGMRILKEEKRLNGEPRKLAHVVLAAVALHNTFALPKGVPDDTAFAVHVVRDADKLDILRVLDEHLSKPGPYSPTVVLKLPDTPGRCGGKVIAAALERRIAAYADLTCVNDFRVLLGTWFFDMHFVESRRQFVADGHGLHLLKGLPDDKNYGEARALLLAELEKFA